MGLNKKQIGVIFFVIFLIFIGGFVSDLVLVFLAFPNLAWVWVFEDKIIRKKLHIVSDGTPIGTYASVGKYTIEHVNRIEIKPLHPGGLIMAEISVYFPKIDLRVDDIKLKDPFNLLSESQLDQVKKHLLVEK